MTSELPFLFHLRIFVEIAENGPNDDFLRFLRQVRGMNACSVG